MNTTAQNKALNDLKSALAEAEAGIASLTKHLDEIDKLETQMAEEIEEAILDHLLAEDNAAKV